MNILIINSDTPNNRGDRAILAGNITLIRRHFPEAKIYSQSENPERDESWYGIKFLRISPYTINPIKIISLMSFARKCDYVLWGGGELLKDYTNKLGVIYWALKMACVRFVNPNIHGLFQGIGPTTSRFSQQLISLTVNRTKSFIVRDQESADKLRKWGVTIPVIASIDPALLLKPKLPDKRTMGDLERIYGIDRRFLDCAVGIGVRRWFHYKKEGWLPFRFKIKNKVRSGSDSALNAYVRNLARVCDQIVEKYDLNLVFFPMHLGPNEDDSSFSRRIIEHMAHGARTCVLDKDQFSPEEFQNIIGCCKAFIGSRLHSTILAIGAGIPSMIFYYVDKGRIFYSQIAMEKYSYPIEELLLDSGPANILKGFDDLIRNMEKIKIQLAQSGQSLRTRIDQDFVECFKSR